MNSNFGFNIRHLVISDRNFLRHLSSASQIRTEEGQMLSAPPVQSIFAGLKSAPLCPPHLFTCPGSWKAPLVRYPLPAATAPPPPPPLGRCFLLFFWRGVIASPPLSPAATRRWLRFLGISLERVRQSGTDGKKRVWLILVKLFLPFSAESPEEARRGRFNHCH